MTASVRTTMKYPGEMPNHNASYHRLNKVEQGSQQVNVHRSANCLRDEVVTRLFYRLQQLIVMPKLDAQGPVLAFWHWPVLICELYDPMWVLATTDRIGNQCRHSCIWKKCRYDKGTTKIYAPLSHNWDLVPIIDLDRGLPWGWVC